jgi:hypothetical protein
MEIECAELRVVVQVANCTTTELRLGTSKAFILPLDKDGLTSIPYMGNRPPLGPYNT